MIKCKLCGQLTPEVKKQRTGKTAYSLLVTYRVVGGDWFQYVKIVHAKTLELGMSKLKDIFCERTAISKNSNTMFQDYLNWVDFKVEEYKNE